MVTLSKFKAETPIEAFEKAWAVLALYQEQALFARFLNRVHMSAYENGVFTLEAETDYIAALFSRHAENTHIRKEIELWVPEGVKVSVIVKVRAVPV